MNFNEIYNLILYADANKDRNLLEQAKMEIDKAADRITELYDLYYYELIKI